MVAEHTKESQLQHILHDPIKKKEAAKQLSARIREVNRQAKATTDRAQRTRLYSLKTALVLLGQQHFGFRPVSWEWDAQSQCAFVLYRLAGCTVHLLSTSINGGVDLRKLRRKGTLVETRDARKQSRFNNSLKPALT